MTNPFVEKYGEFDVGALRLSFIYVQTEIICITEKAF